MDTADWHLHPTDCYFVHLCQISGFNHDISLEWKWLYCMYNERNKMFSLKVHALAMENKWPLPATTVMTKLQYDFLTIAYIKFDS